MPQIAPLSWLFIPSFMFFCFLLVLVSFWWASKFYFCFEVFFSNSVVGSVWLW